MALIINGTTVGDSVTFNGNAVNTVYANHDGQCTLVWAKARVTVGALSGLSCNGTVSSSFGEYKDCKVCGLSYTSNVQYVNGLTICSLTSAVDTTSSRTVSLPYCVTGNIDSSEYKVEISYTLCSNSGYSGFTYHAPVNCIYDNCTSKYISEFTCTDMISESITCRHNLTSSQQSYSVTVSGMNCASQNGYCMLNGCIPTATIYSDFVYCINPAAISRTVKLKRNGVVLKSCTTCANETVTLSV